MLKPVHILLIDDDAADRKAIRRSLQEAGLRADVHEGADAATGLRLFKTMDFECVFLDYRLPDRDGTEVLPELVADKARCAAVIVLTGQGNPKLAVEMMAAGAVDYLTKDEITPSILQRAVRHALARRQFLIAQEEQRRQELEELQEAVAAHRRLTGWQDGAITAQSAGVGPLRERSPTVFSALQRDYATLLDAYLEALAFDQPPPWRDIGTLAHRLGDEGAGPRDVVDLYIGVVTAKCADANPKRARAYTQNGRLLALEVMGHLVDYYRLTRPVRTKPVAATECTT